MSSTHQDGSRTVEVDYTSSTGKSGTFGSQTAVEDGQKVTDRQLTNQDGKTWEQNTDLSRDGKTLYKLTKDGTKVGSTTFQGGASVGTLVWTGEYYWTVYGGPKGLGRWDADGNLMGSIYPAADGTWAITWDGSCLWTIQRTCEEWDDDKIFRIEVLDDSLGTDQLE